jgi:dTDP-4-amino-4,6-dideoxyglucose
MVRRLEKRLQRFLDVGHVVCFTNGTVALMALAKALGIAGEVIVPTFTFPATVQALLWAGLTPVLADVDAETHMLSPEGVEKLLTPRTSAILGVHLWGSCCHPEEFETFARNNGLVLFFDACHAFGCTANDRKIGSFGAGEAFSFHATKIVNAMEGGAISTNDPVLADRLRDKCNLPGGKSIGLETRMSEAQAAMALLSLEDYSVYRQRNHDLYLRYQKGLSEIPGLTMVVAPPTIQSNCQYVVIEVDQQRYGLDRDALFDVLLQENIVCRKHFCPPLHRWPGMELKTPSNANGFAVAERLSQRVLQLPTGGNLPPGAVEKICEHLAMIARHAPSIARKMNSPTSC